MTKEQCLMQAKNSTFAANVIALPTAVAERVQQRRGPGRHPKHVVNLSRFRADKRVAAQKTAEAWRLANGPGRIVLTTNDGGRYGVTTEGRFKYSPEALVKALEAALYWAEERALDEAVMGKTSKGAH
ncbi:hypothetical protein [Paraburkholderia sp. UCT2]|uniref:hypothetical protein n=1 Tax=Paraburkholderia sp. UCT2 TaxID=2615208 RepID=UPI0016565B3B|nr:hypothetical protein [Paraburkholderia sp. UCT2]MBC8729971.1 hypothetical protein [Paraburkholderia sp. UCT2]